MMRLLLIVLLLSGCAQEDPPSPPKLGCKEMGGELVSVGMQEQHSLTKEGYPIFREQFYCYIKPRGD